MSHAIAVCRHVIFYLVEEALENTKEEDKGKNHCDEQAWFWYKCCFCCCLRVSAITSLA
jgi:hypothetical protein